MLLLKRMSGMARVTQMRAAMKTKVVMRAATKMKVVMKAPTSTQALRIGLMVICSTKHEGLSKKYVLLDNDLNVLPMLSKVETSTAGGRMRKDLLCPLSPSNCF